jgi:hypothetical protein
MHFLDETFFTNGNLNGIITKITLRMAMGVNDTFAVYRISQALLTCEE